MTRGPTNKNLKKVIDDLNSLYGKEGVKVWRNAARFLKRPARQRVKVNLLKINKLSKDGETALIPGDVLGVGDLSKKINVAGIHFSERAKEKINKSGKSLTIQELIKENPKGKKIRLII